MKDQQRRKELDAEQKATWHLWSWKVAKGDNIFWEVTSLPILTLGVFFKSSMEFLLKLWQWLYHVLLAQFKISYSQTFDLSWCHSPQMSLATTWFSKIHSYHITFLQNMIPLIPLNPTYLYLDQQLTSKITIRHPGMDLKNLPGLRRVNGRDGTTQTFLGRKRVTFGNHFGGDMGRNPAIVTGMNSKCFLPKNWWMSQKLGISCRLFRGINDITFVEVKWLKCNLSVHSDLVFVIHLWWIVRVSAWLDLGICLVEIGNYIRSITHMSAWVTVFVCYLRYAFSWIRHARVLLDII